MKLKFLFSLCLLLISTSLLLAYEPQAIELNDMVVYQPQGDPGSWEGQQPPCYTCFSATISGKSLSVNNNSGELANLVVTDLTTYSVVLSTPVVSQSQNELPEGLYKLEIYPTSYAPMEGYFEVEE